MSSAIMSPCGTYRYALSRNLETPRLFNAVTQRCLFVMLNPSTADASTDDATIRRCKAYASSWSYHVLDVVNLFALRSTDPTALREHTDPVGPDNDSHIANYARHASFVVVAWGSHARQKNGWAHNGRAAHVMGILREAGADPRCFGVTGNNQPRHPVRLAKDAPLFRAEGFGIGVTA
jgi:hypothetical protein